MLRGGKKSWIFSRFFYVLLCLALSIYKYITISFSSLAGILRRWSRLENFAKIYLIFYSSCGAACCSQIVVAVAFVVAATVVVAAAAVAWLLFSLAQQFSEIF